ncbi:MAG: hypothetical protein AB1798_00495 [Spirochaetota bacterium]
MIKKIWIGLVLFALLSSVSLAQEIKTDAFVGDLKDALTKTSQGISNKMGPFMGFYGGSGNVLHSNVYNGFSLKLGGGLGFAVQPLWVKIINDISQGKEPDLSIFEIDTSGNAGLFSAIPQALVILPLPYDEAYLKLGFSKRAWDIGVRIGYVPDIGRIIEQAGSALPPGISFTTGALHVGGELRYRLFKWFLFQADARLSVDYDSGRLGIRYEFPSQSQTVEFPNPVPGGAPIQGTATFDAAAELLYNWSGLLISPKLVGNVMIPILGGVYGGIGLDFNIGGVKTNMTMDSRATMTVTAAGYTLDKSSASIYIEAPTTKKYRFFDARVMVGARLLFVNIAIEYGVLSKNASLTILPLTLSL